jgi:hypothetical protein
MFLYSFNTFWLLWEVWAEKRPDEWLGEVLGVSGLAPSARKSQINQKALKGYPFTRKIYFFLFGLVD